MNAVAQTMVEQPRRAEFLLGVHFAIREGTPGDRAYIAQTWTQSHGKWGCLESKRHRLKKKVGQTDLHASTRAYASRVLHGLQEDGEIRGRPPARVFVATPVLEALGPDASPTDLVLGYLVVSADGRTLHYAYVREPYRSKGMARALVKAADLSRVVQFSHRTVYSGRVTKYARGAVFNPYS